MILKASQRGGGRALGLHLNSSENEHITVHEIRGFLSGNIVDALREAEAIAKGTRCKQPLFSLSLSPPERESVATEIFEKALAEIEKRVGLEGQG
ncbi:hypothetical protein [Asticcacaulis machinosus]|uniref:Uncharacterized protein n=1 Tax=Asticcacaulis machinosus TaxID=2984211 RepID=A0ABT5HNG8_9CAUL|nr:hypothetical protein [Asticcacaulis machinosus]MDC7677791.1 hypothetical protein [Asticcacaulis machinosus]